MNSDWTKTLSSLAPEDAPPLCASPAAATRDARVQLDAEHLHTRTARRKYLHMLGVANAAKHLKRLPKRGETHHCIMRGNYNGWDLVPAVLRLAEGARIAELNICTLGFNQQNATELVELLDDGRVGRCTFICSVYYRSMKDGQPVYDALAEALTARGHRIAAIRCHAKILLMELTDGRCITVESSANLRSCRNIEQFTMTHDRELLHLFHRQWMREILDVS
jgi:hypothetical protein